MPMFGPASEPGWYHSPKACALSTEAVGLHFVSWSWASQWPKYLGHIALHTDRYLLMPRGTARVLRLRGDLLEAGLRRPCAGSDSLCRRDQFTRLGSQSGAAWLAARNSDGSKPTSTWHLTVDHHVPIALGGGNDRDNLRVLCRSCNSRKGARF